MVLFNDRKNKDIKGKRIKLYITGQYYIQVKIFHPKLNLNFFCLLGDKGKLIENQPRRTAGGARGAAAPPKFWAAQTFLGTERKFGQNQFFKAIRCL